MRGCLLSVLFFLGVPAIVLACLFYDGRAAHELHDAARAGDSTKVEELLDRGVDANARIRDFHMLGKRDTVVTCAPIVCAGLSGEPEVVQLLLDRGARVDTRGWRNKTALIMSTSAEVTRILLAAGADSSLRDSDGHTALEACMVSGGVSEALVLFEATKERADGESMVTRAVERARWAAAHDGNSNAHTYLNVFGSWLRERRGEVDPPLHVAAREPSETDDLVSLLRSISEIDQRDAGGWTALHWAAGVLGDDEKTRLLLAAGATPDAVSSEGWTPLLAAAEAGATQRAKDLLEAGADPNRVERIGERAALHLARDADLVRALLDAGADVRLQDGDGWLPIDGPRNNARFRAEDGREADANGSEVLAMLERALVDNPLRAQDIVQSKDEDLGRRVRKHIWVHSLEVSPVPEGEVLTFRIGASRLPVDVAFDVLVRIDGRELPAGSWCDEKGTSNGAELAVTWPESTGDHVDVVLRPNPELAALCLEAREMWGEDVVFEDLPLHRVGAPTSESRSSR